MSELTDAFKAAQAEAWSKPADAVPAERVEPIAGFWDQMDNAAAHHDCPMKRVTGRCNCVLND